MKKAKHKSKASSEAQALLDMGCAYVDAKTVKALLAEIKTARKNPDPRSVRKRLVKEVVNWLHTRRGWQTTVGTVVDALESRYGSGNTR